MAIKEAVFIMFFITLLVAMDAKEPDEVRATVNDGGDENGVGGRMEEKINEITRLVKKRRFNTKRKQVLRLLNELSAMTEECEPECEAGWVRHGKSCYYIDDTPTQAWSTARAACQSRGADLPIIQSADENEFIADLVLKQDKITWGGAWIGILRNQGNDRLYWIDGTPVDGGYTAWAPTNPGNSGGREDCGHIFGVIGAGYEDYRRKWNDVHCNLVEPNFIDMYPVILCEKSI